MSQNARETRIVLSRTLCERKMVNQNHHQQYIDERNKHGNPLFVEYTRAHMRKQFDNRIKISAIFFLNFVMLLADEQNVCRLQRSLVGSPCSHHHRKSVAIVYFNVFFHHFALLYPLSANILIIVQMACVCVNDSARKSLL